MTLRRFKKHSKTRSDAVIFATNTSPGVECEQCGEWCNPQSLRAPLGNQAGPDPYCIISKSFYFFSVFEIPFCMFRACCFFLESSRILTNRIKKPCCLEKPWLWLFSLSKADERWQIKKVRLSPQLRSNSVKGSVSGR